MRPPPKRTLARWALLAGGLWLVGMGVYFLLARPALLPEDERFLGATLDVMARAAPHLATWLGHIWRVLGGFITAWGIAVVWLGLRGDAASTHLPLAVMGLATNAWMVAVNFALGSDFRWVLAAALAPWAVALAATLTGRRRRGAPPP